MSIKKANAQDDIQNNNGYPQYGPNMRYGGMMPGWGMPGNAGNMPQPGIPPWYGTANGCPFMPWGQGYYPAGISPTPYGNSMQRAVGYPPVYIEEMENERDMQKLKEFYPEVAKEILVQVEEECDKMEYDGSLMFDEYPDRVMLNRVKNSIYDNVKEKYPVDENDDRDAAMVMQQESRRRYPPKKNWLGDMIEVLLYQEMYRRRCRRRNCRRW